MSPKRQTSRRAELVRRFWERFDSRYEVRRETRHAVVTGVTRDNTQRAIGVQATIDGVSQHVSIDFGMPAAVGDCYVVENRGSPTMPKWAYLSRLSSTQGQPNLDPSPTLPAPTSLSLLSGHGEPFAGGGIRAWIYAEWLHIGDSFGPMTYEVQFRLSEQNPPGTPVSLFTTYHLESTRLDGAIDNSQTIIIRDVNDGETADFPQFGRIRIESERIDYTKVRYEDTYSGVGTGSSGQLVDSGASWTDNEWEGYALTDSASTIFLIESSTSNTLYVTGTPASGSYTIKPCFSGCSRGAGGSSPAAHVDDTGVATLSWGCMIEWLEPDRYYDVRVRCHRQDGAVSAWTAWSSITTDIDNVPPPDPTGLTVADAPLGVDIAWTGPVLASVPDLAGFYLYSASSSSGTGATQVQTIGCSLHTFYPMDAGVTRYFNLKAFDTSGNVSGYAEVTWVKGTSLYGPGAQLLVNADFERPNRLGSQPDAWAVGKAIGDTFIYDNTGMLGGKCVGVTFATSNYYLFVWQLNTSPSSIGIPVTEGEVYSASLYYKSTISDANIIYRSSDDSGTDIPSGKLAIAPQMIVFYTNGSSEVKWLEYGDGYEDAIVVESRADGWKRIAVTHKITAADLTTTYGTAQWIGFRVYIYNKCSTGTVRIDRPELEMGTINPWGPGLVPPGGGSIQGLAIDSWGIRSASGDFVLNSDGHIESTLVINPTAANDAIVVMQLDDVDKWSLGVDDSDGDRFKICDDSSLYVNAPFELIVTQDTRTRLVIGSQYSVAGPSDAEIGFEINGAGTWTVGADDSDGGRFKFCQGYSLTLAAPFEFVSVDDSATTLIIGSQYAVGGPSDAQITFELNGTASWTIGVDDNDSDRFKLNYGSSLIMSSCLEITTTGNVFALLDFRATSGLVSGDVTLNASPGDVLFTNQLQSYKGSTSYNVFGYHKLDAPVLGWNAQTGKTDQSIDLQASPWSLPSDIKAVYAVLTFTASTGTATVYLKQDSGESNQVADVGVIADQYQPWRAAGIVRCDPSTGNIYYDTSNSAGTVSLAICGYFI